MILDNSVLAIIPARGGSKGVTRKNIRKLAGKPLIAWTIQEAKKSKYIDRLILSSEDEEIIGIAKYLDCEVPFKRPVEFARDDTPGIRPVLHALETLKEKYDYVVLLQPTSPLRIVEDIDQCIEMCIRNEVSACISVCKVTQHPFWMYEINETGFMMPVMEQMISVNLRQDLPNIYIPNGGVYVSKVDVLLKHKSFVTPSTIAHIMPKERSLDIDEEIDFDLCELIFNKKCRR